MSTRITLAPGWTLIQEQLEIPFTSTNQTVLARLIEGADPASIAWQSARRGRVQAESWKVVDSVQHPESAGGGRQREATGWREITDLKGDAPRVFAEPEGVLVEFSAPWPGRHRVTLSYLVGEWTHHVMYHLAARGDLIDPESSMTLDLEGWLEIENPTTRELTNVSILLIAGEEANASLPARVARGFLDLDPESPLADLWRDPDPLPGVLRPYPIATSVNLPGGSSTAIPLASAERRPVRRVYTVESERIPTDIRGPGFPLRQTLVIRNDRSLSEGRALPPGRVMIYHGAMRSLLLRESRSGHIPPDGEWSIELGPVPELRISRRSRGRIPSAAGFVESTWELLLENESPRTYPVEIRERPPLTLSWTISRSNRAFEQRDRFLVFQASVGPRSQFPIEYTLRVREPGMMSGGQP
ncbi:MAG TPA: hypothetical protein PKE55_00845 [Kiritimatiellia bacterium]|nr:hypothetical protein [Kiritimatiellia bacterium]